MSRSVLQHWFLKNAPNKKILLACIDRTDHINLKALNLLLSSARNRLAR
ncbi:hypothetical protein HC248_01005 [Polaromonas vacuolata]|uniref:Uncharacterized protein n=1 Tax=Polaromonas vacuolata TaxID=37448 RepID=A0A6H2H7F4_9BURK|nr:hypothetical protein HC248_01005 [Polaromonas vacuolata]